MKRMLSHSASRSRLGTSLIEVLIASAAFSVVMGGIMAGFSMFNRTYALTKDYAMARLTLSDYLNMDLRRSKDLTATLLPGVTRGGWQTTDWTLPLVITIPNYNQTGGSPNTPVRYSLTTAELDAAKATAIARGKLPPATWGITYGAAAVPRLVVYQQDGQKIIRREGFGTVSRPTASTPTPVTVAEGVIQITGVHQVTADLTPEDLTEPPPNDVNTTFTGNYTIQYTPSAFSKATPQINTLINNEILLRTQYYGL
ncbi:MAG: hypothetical protein ABMA01_13850 [Chthoniobacteraceae bacterium]